MALAMTGRRPKCHCSGALFALPTETTEFRRALAKQLWWPQDTPQETGNRAKMGDGSNRSGKRGQKLIFPHVPNVSIPPSSVSPTQLFLP